MWLDIQIFMKRKWKWKSLSRSLRPHGILQARILEWLAVPFSRASSQPRDWTQVSRIVSRFFTTWATREAQELWTRYPIPSPGDLPDPGIELGCPALQADSLPTELSGNPTAWCSQLKLLFLASEALCNLTHLTFSKSVSFLFFQPSYSLLAR